MAQIRATVPTISTLPFTLILMFAQRPVPLNRPQQVRFLTHRISIISCKALRISPQPNYTHMIPRILPSQIHAKHPIRLNNHQLNLAQMPYPPRPQRAVQIRHADPMRHHGFGQHAPAEREGKGLRTQQRADVGREVRAEVRRPELPEHEHG